MTQKAGAVRRDQRVCHRLEEVDVLLALGMAGLGIATFVALIGFVEFCDRV